MKTKLSAVWLIWALATRLTAQNSASHQILINIVRPNSVSVTNLTTQSVTMDLSAEPSSPVSLLKWQTDGRAKKITLDAQQGRSLRIQTASLDLSSGKEQSLLNMDQNLILASHRGSDQCLIKWRTKECGQDNGPIKVALTVIEI